MIGEKISSRKPSPLLILLAFLSKYRMSFKFTQKEAKSLCKALTSQHPRRVKQYLFWSVSLFTLSIVSQKYLENVSLYRA